MIYSMTGFGTSTFENEKIRISVEVKTLNSKQLDLNTRLPKVFTEYDATIRSSVNKHLHRGKVNLFVDVQHLNLEEGKASINKEIVKKYYEELKETADFLGVDGGDLFKKALELPQAIEMNNNAEASDEEVKLFTTVLEEALVQCNDFRKEEGAALEAKLNEYINTIEDLLKQVIEFDPQRVENVRKRITERMESFVGTENYDTNRFEQELIYYIEKLDISEEKVRLQTHLDYFRKVMNSGEFAGKKLGFIGQEIGREINTIGSKANDSDIQKLVVCMKDELEKIKEQVLNVL